MITSTKIAGNSSVSGSVETETERAETIVTLGRVAQKPGNPDLSLAGGSPVCK